MTKYFTCSQCKTFYFGFGNIWNLKPYCQNCIGKVQFKSYFNYIRSSPVISKRDYLSMDNMKKSINQISLNTDSKFK